MAMTPMGERIGIRLTQMKRAWVVAFLSFILGFIITISEPDLQVLAEQVPSVPNYILILAVAAGVGIFLVAAVLRMLLGIPLSYMLLALYPMVFILAAFVQEDFMAVAFDSGGVTTGPMTVPFIMALGIGFSAVRSDKHAENDSFRSDFPLLGGTDPGSAGIGDDLSSGRRSIFRDRYPECGEFRGTGKNVCGGASEVYGRDSGVASSCSSIFRRFPDHFPAPEKEDSGKNPDWSGLYISGAGIVPDRE